ncbi:tRNA (adenosine(37)-N6)-dimethylallyltransferase MiaA [Cytobacillus solani]|uniref:tRNA (adenosine(37)-N6)-dimethylallyltransferase MiaA n=1 Tax=Cytobacillus solani TaxID=1637975 RepID=UPI00207994FC|nr:tRNA (adenosine(37)-N6)-dimethylallyltransferase MiaA [Cytobacillus solani]USK57537.1 tRNA (adenosine(37)-N6)-dimethylallyltransferase MiaA [Cytobacillus solani]
MKETDIIVGSKGSECRLNKREKLVVLIGPTAVGKTKLSIELAKRFNGEIISGDSMQIYKGMDIGTAKIMPSEMEGIPHHLIDIKNPDEPFSVAEFQELVRLKIAEISQRGKLPMIVGGTGLYIQSVICDYQFSDAPSDDHFRIMLEKRADIEGNEKLHRELMEVDPESANKIHPNNVRRVIRALEVYHVTGKTVSNYQKNQQPELMYQTAMIGLTMEREMLYERINKRVDLMINVGLLPEVEKLYVHGLKGCQSIQAIGYKEIYEYFQAHVTLEEAITQLKQNSRRYAKRQLTWFRNKMNVDWFDMTDAVSLGGFEKKLDEISTYIEGKLQLKSNT